MTWPTTTTPLRRAVMHALTKPTGRVSAIPEHQLFVRGLPFDSRSSVGDVRKRPSAWAIVRDPAADIPTNEMSGERRVRVTVQIATSFWAGNESIPAEVEAQLDALAEHTHALLNALTYPGSLATDDEGNATGLDGGSLRAANASEWRSQGPDQIGTTRMLRVVHYFTATVTLTR